MWWDDVWLKEGMASWLMMVATDSQYTDFNHSDDFFIYTSMLPGLKLDGYSSSHPIKNPVRTRNEVHLTFYSLKLQITGYLFTGYFQTVQ